MRRKIFGEKRPTVLETKIPLAQMLINFDEEDKREHLQTFASNRREINIGAVTLKGF